MVTVCSGLRSTTNILFKQVEADGADAWPLEGQDTNYTPMAQSVADEVRGAVSRIPLKPPKCQVYLNLGWRVAAGTDPAAFEHYLWKSLTSPIAWDEVISDAITRNIS